MMDQPLNEIKQAAEGLLFMSETDHPFEIVELKEDNVPAALQKLTGKAPIETQTLDYFFRNHVKEDRFVQLKNVLHQHLSDIQVYRIGTIQIDAFIIGKLKNGL